VKDPSRTNQELLKENSTLKQRIQELEQSESERKRAEEALRESEERYRSLVENANEAIYVAQDGMLKFVNRAGVEIAGYSEQEIISKPFIEFIHPDDRAMVGERYLRRLKGEGFESRYTFRFIAKNGNIKWLELGAALIDFEGRPATLNVVTDITDRKRAEETLREQEIKLSSIFRAAPVGIGVVFNRVFKEANDMLCQMTGYSREELLGQNARMLYTTQEDYDYVGQVKYRQISEEGTGTLETRWQKKDNTVIDIILSSTPLDPDDLAKGVTFTALDITERKQAEGSLRESKERFRALSENAPDIIYTMNLLGAITYVNPSWKRIFGHDEEEVLGRYFIEFTKEEDKRTYRKLFKSIRDEEKSVNNHIGVMLTKEGKERIFNMNSSFNRDSEGRILGIVGSMKDVTELRDIEKKLSQAEKMEAIGTLAGGIAHDFNNILSAIIGYTQLGIDALDEERRKRYLNQVLKSGERAKNLTSQILAFSRQDKQERSPIEVGGIVKEAMKLLRSLLPTTIEIRQEIESKPNIVLSNSIHVHQVLMNLCTNAAYAMRDKGGILQVCIDHIQLPARENSMIVDLQPGSYIRMIVRDTGHGIDPGIIDRIFDPFFTTKKLNEGTGLGLSVVYGIVKSHGGTIAVHSEPGKGSTFSVYFPRIEVEIEHKSEKQPPIAKGTERVLFVDDEPVLADIGKEGLSALGYEVTVRTSSIEALHAFRAQPHKFDLVITDMTMPNMTGIELADEILKVRSDIPIILCTGYSEMIDEEKSKKFGIRAFLMKPVSLEEIARTIRKVLDK
jgi:PAS domain S-box-containing protein